MLYTRQFSEGIVSHVITLLCGLCVCVPFGWWVEMITEQAAGGSILKSCIYFGERVNAKHGECCFANWCFVVMWLIWVMTVGD